MIKLAIVGSRTFNDYNFLEEQINNKYKNNIIKCIISGGAVGVDKLAEKYVEKHLIPIIVHLPEWNKYGKSAGYIRNQLIVNDADIIVAFWDGISKGTKISIDLARKSNKVVEIINI